MAQGRAGVNRARGAALDKPMPAMGGKRALTKMAPDHHCDGVLTVRTAPLIQPEAQGGWEFLLWFDDALRTGHTLNFRPFLDNMVAILNRSRPAALQLPDYRQDENFVSGRLQFGEHQLSVYYEDDFAAYLSIYAADRDPVVEVLAVLLPHIVVQEDL